MSPPLDLSPLWLSLRVAICATLLSVAIGLPVGYILGRRRVIFRALWEGTVLLPLVLPPTVLGYYLLVGLGRGSWFGRLYHALTGSDLVFTWQGATIAACLVGLPLLIRTAQAAFSEVDGELLDVANTLGATEGQTIRYVILPLARRGILAGIGLAFARSLGDFGATLMVAGDIPGLTRTMPLAVYDAVAADDNHTAALYVLLLSAVCFVFALLASRLTSRPEH